MWKYKIILWKYEGQDLRIAFVSQRMKKIARQIFWVKEKYWLDCTWLLLEIPSCTVSLTWD